MCNYFPFLSGGMSFSYGWTPVAQRLSLLSIQKLGFLNDDHFIFQEPLLTMKCLKVLKTAFYYKMGSIFINIENCYNLQLEIGPQNAEPGNWENAYFWHDNLWWFYKILLLHTLPENGVSNIETQHSGLESFQTYSWRLRHHLILRKFSWLKQDSSTDYSICWWQYQN